MTPTSNILHQKEGNDYGDHDGSSYKKYWSRGVIYKKETPKVKNHLKSKGWKQHPHESGTLLHPTEGLRHTVKFEDHYEPHKNIIKVHKTTFKGNMNAY